MVAQVAQHHDWHACLQCCAPKDTLSLLTSTTSWVDNHCASNFLVFSIDAFKVASSGRAMPVKYRSSATSGSLRTLKEPA